MTEYALTDFRTGKRLTRVKVTRGPWDDRLGAAENISVTLNLRDPSLQRLDPYALTTPGKTCIAVLEGDSVMAHGPIWARRYDRDKGTLELGASGMLSYWDHRLILPAVAKTYGLDQWIIPDPADPTKTIPNPALASTYTGIWLGTIVKRVIQQAQAYVGGNVPLVFQDDEVDGNPDHNRTIEGTEFRLIGDFIRDTSKANGGPEFNFQGKLTADRMGIETLFQAGTVANPLITSPSLLRWSITAPNTPVSNFQATETAEGMTSLSWQTGGRKENTVMVGRAYDQTLIDAGFPLFETLDSSHTDESDQAKLDGFAAAEVANRPIETWSFDVDMRKPPLPSAYNVGDFANLKIDRYDPKKRVGDPFYRDGGTFTRRIVGRSGDEKGQKMHLDFAPAVSGS